MWKCPACETLNNNDKCVICGEPKPADGGTSVPVKVAPAPPRIKASEIPAYSPEIARTSTYEDGLDPTPKLEYKPKEPRNHSFLSNVWRSLTLISESGVQNLGVTIDVGHSFEAYEDVAEAAVAAMKRGKLFHLHMNDNWKFWDDDMIAGSIHTIEYIELFWWLKHFGYTGYISTDQYPYREDGKCAVEQSIKWMQAFERAAANIDDKRMLAILAKNDAVESTAYMREILFGC